jgi:small subunit ribosomal protein S15
MLDKKLKEKIIAKFRTHPTDTGSSQVQIAILSEEIKQLSDHLKSHKKDFSSRRGLLKKVAERRKLLRYFEREDAAAATELAKKLKIKLPKREVKEEEPEEVVTEMLGAAEEKPSVDLVAA